MLILLAIYFKIDY